MTQIDRSAPVLVTGGAGFIASWIVRYLLEDGFVVRATVRNPTDEQRLTHLKELGQKYPGKLQLFAADLLQAGAFQEAMQGCQLVMHTASPFMITGIKDAQKQLVEPAVQGTREVLEEANRCVSVRRVVLTSSIVAIMGDGADAAQVDGGVFNETHWNFSSSLKRQPYAFSKKLAEEEAWKIARQQQRWDLVVVNPAFVLGPALSGRAESVSINFIRSMTNGEYRPGCPDLTMSIVDVRDVARAHILAGLIPSASGRHILAADTVPMIELARQLSAHYGRRFPLPTRVLPKFMLYLIGPFFGLSWDYISRNVGAPYSFDASYSKKDLGLEYRPIQQTLVDAVEQALSAGQV
ncbi:MAG: NAD-dependent epimerase/dehydratase family protein [Leptospirales bacterium]|nr:NAD-dependent epimerase/dehydratase family protein [Leptospirales bacterium]